MATAATLTAPDYRLAYNSQDITDRIQGRLISLTLTDNDGPEADQLDLVLDDADGTLALPSRGVALSLALGWQDEALVDKGTFIVDEVEHSGSPDTLTIRARSADMRDALNTRRERSWSNIALGVLLGGIAKQNKLGSRVAEVLAGTVLEHVDQTSESDMNLMTRLAREFDAVATVKSGLLLFMPRGTGLTASGKALDAMTITRASGDSHRFSIAERDSYTGVRAYYHDLASSEKKEVLYHPESRDDELATSADNVLTLRHTYATKSNAERAAKSEWQRLQRGVATLSITLARGRPELAPQQPMTVQGFKPAIDSAEWIITRASHSLSTSGLTTALELELKA